VAAPAGAADLKVISAGAVRGLIAQIIDDYSRQTGPEIRLHHRHHRPVARHHRVRAACGFDHRVGPVDGGVGEDRKLTTGSRAELGRVGIGVAIRDGATAPDVSTPDTLKKALIDARSVAYTNPAEGGTSGSTLTSVAERFGIGDAIRQKAVLTRGGREAAIEVAEGRAELGDRVRQRGGGSQRREARRPAAAGAAGLFGLCDRDPVEQHGPGAARAFIAALTSTAMAERWRANGFEPPK